MFVIKDISMKIKRMLDCADRYVDDAALFQSTEPDAAMMYANVGEKLLACAMDLHGVAVKAIQKQRAQDVEPPTARMQQLWDEDHRYLVAKHAEISQKIKTLKSM